VSLSPALGKNKKVEQHIRNKTHKPNVLRFWVEGGVIPLYIGSCLIVWDLSGVSSSDSPNKCLKALGFGFWVEGGVISLCEFGLVLILVRSPQVWVWLSFHSCEIFPVLSPRIIQQVVSEPMVCGWITLYSSVSLNPTLGRNEKV